MYIPTRVYKGCGIGVRNHRGAEPPRDPESPGLVRTVRRRDRAATGDATADRVQAPPGAARGRLRRVHHRRTAPCLPAETRRASGAGCVACAVPAILVGSRRCARASPRSHAPENVQDKKEDEEQKMTDRERYTPGPASG